jgi:hypothetical protein
MMSGWDTVARCPYYSVLINPGNAEVNPPPPSESARWSLCDLQKGYNYWYSIDARDPGRSHYHRVMDRLGGGPSVPVGNALFRRSSGTGTLATD